jgi:glycerol-3-phosphate dehydrogenase
VDPEAGSECIRENRILQKIAQYCIEPTEGFFIRTSEDDEDYELRWIAACKNAGIETVNIPVTEALRMEQNLSPGQCDRRLSSGMA